MPVSLSEWRVRIGTFVHWIREYEVKERRERLLKERIRRLKVLCERLEAKWGDSGEESEDDKSRQDGPDPKGCPHKTVKIWSSGNSSDIKDLLTCTSCDQCIQDLLTASDSHIKEILTPSGCTCNIKELITPNDCSIKSPNTLNGSTIKDVIAPNDSGIKELVTTNDSRIQDLVEANDDSKIQDLLTTNYSSTCIRDPITPKYCSVKDLSKNAGTKPLDTPNDSCTKESTSLNASSIKDLITPDYSSIKDLITSEYSNVKDLISSNDSKIDSTLSPNETNIKQLIKPDNDNIEERLAQAYDYVKTSHTIDDESIEQDTHVCDSEEQHISDFSISPRHSLSDATVREHLSPSCPSTKDLRTPTDDLNTDVIIKTSYVKDHETQSDGSVKELSSPGSGTTVCRPFAPCDDILVELLKPTVSASKDLPSIDLCCHEHFRRNDPFSGESGKLPHFLGKEQHPQPDASTKESTDDELLKEHRTSAGSCKKSKTEPSILTAVSRSPVVPFVSKKHCISERYVEMGKSASSCRGPALKSKTDLIPAQIPPFSELLLLKSGDVELNPGPREAAWWSLELEGELLSLVKEVSPIYYSRLCNALGVMYAESQAIFVKNGSDMPKSLFEVIHSWGLKQSGDTHYKRLLDEKLRSVHLNTVGTKLLEGGFLTQDTPTQSSVTDEVHHVNKLTQEEVIQCGKEFKRFYRTEMCKIKTDPLDFESLKKFEDIYTNLEQLRNKMGTKIKTPLEYDELLTEQINDEFPKRILVEGEGGAGKTTFCSKIAWDWANGYEAYKHFDWVIVIPMQEIQNCKTVGDFAKRYLSDGNMVNARQIDDYILCEPSKVLIILDELDEYSRDIFSDESDFGKIIRSEKFKECVVLVTSRPWKAKRIKCHQRLCKIYTFITVEGFSSENVSSYINKYFADDNMAGADLIKFMEDNDVIKMNMAPFPIYVAMLCSLWQGKERREVIRELKTFSQLIHQMITFHKGHYLSKSSDTIPEIFIEAKRIDKLLIEVGKIAFSVILDKRLTLNENDFSLCKNAMDICNKIGILREKQFVRRFEKAGTEIQPGTSNVSFPHTIFQEYVAALYLASLYKSNDVEYKTLINKILEGDVYEFRYLLYFTSSQGEGVGLDIINRLDCKDDFLVDVAFEASDAATGKVVGQRIFREQKSLEIDGRMSAHTLSGYLFIMEQHAMKTLILSGRKCGLTVSHDIADALSSPSSLTTLQLSKMTFHDDFYRFLLCPVSKSKRGESINAVRELHIDHWFINDLQKFDTTIEDLFPRLIRLTFTTVQTVSPGVVKRLAHPNLAVLSIEHGKEGGYLVPLIGEPVLLGQLFSSSFPQLAYLTFRELVIGNIRSEAILRHLKNHLHLESISIIKCFTYDELDPLAEQMNTEKMKITLQHDTAQRTLSFGSSIGPLTIDMIDSLCHGTCVQQLDVLENGVKIAGEECFPDFNGRKVDSKICMLSIIALELHDNQSASCCLGKFLSLLCHLTDLEIGQCDFHDAFYKEIADRAFSCRIQTVNLDFKVLSNSASKLLAKFLWSLPRLTNFDMDDYVHDAFFIELGSMAAQLSCQNLYFREKKHTRMLENYWSARKRDMPSTSGIGAAPVESERIPDIRKRIHINKAKDDGDRVDESLKQRPGKERAKTDHTPTSCLQMFCIFSFFAVFVSFVFIMYSRFKGT